jgi:hypothetical protein
MVAASALKNEEAALFYSVVYTSKSILLKFKKKEYTVDLNKRKVTVEILLGIFSCLIISQNVLDFSKK